MFNVFMWSIGTEVLTLCHRVGVTSEPDHTSVELIPQDKFIILASDGVWEFISSKEAVDIVAQFDSAEEACRQVSKVVMAYAHMLHVDDPVLCHVLPHVKNTNQQ